MKKILFFSCIIFFATQANAQFTRYIVKLKNKGGTPHTIANPTTYLSAKAINRRTKYNIALDSTDLPITPRYLDSIRLTPNVTILNYSKWLNQVAIKTTDPNAIIKINSFNFVTSTTGLAAKTNFGISIYPSKNKFTLEEEIITNTKTTETTQQTSLAYGSSAAQISIHKGEFLHDYGFLGQNMTIAMMDAGFNSVATNIGIDSLRINNQIKGTWDFVANESSVTEDDAHGFYCLSIIGANKTGTMIGSSPKSNFYLYRTEDVASEYPVEEQNWVAAAELADSIGVDVFSTSLGYLDFDNAVFDYSYLQRNGNTAMMTRGADLAAKKGILVCNSAGNNGNGSGSFVDYKYVAVPADGDSVLAVGACNTSGVIANFSAWGPTSSGKVKPNVTSVGVSTAFINLGGTPSNGNGTSFSNPNIAGLITDLWQAFPELSNMGIIDITQESAHLYNAPDGRYGYGIPNMKKAFILGLKRIETQTSSINNCLVNINFNSKDNGASTYEIQRKLNGETTFNTIKTIASTVGAFALKNYTTKDSITTPTFGTVTYRIKHIMGVDTSFTYPEFTQNYTTNCAVIVPPTPVIAGILIAPNPIKDILKIKVTNIIATSLFVKITDSKGASIYKSAIENNVTTNIITSAWSKGVYIVEIIDGNKTVTIKKIVKG
jgi:serine protease AprX